jgi:hypothetical protein
MEYTNISDEVLGRKTTCKKCSHKFLIDLSVVHKDEGMIKREDKSSQDKDLAVESKSNSNMNASDMNEEAAESFLEKIGSGIMVLGLVSIFISFLGLKLRIMFWMDLWGPKIGWALMVGMFLLGGMIWIIELFRAEGLSKDVIKSIAKFFVGIVVVFAISLYKIQSNPIVEKDVVKSEVAESAIGRDSVSNVQSLQSLQTPKNNSTEGGNENLDASFYTKQGDEFAKIQKYSEAVNSYDESLKIIKTSEAYSKKASALIMLSKYNEALESINKAIEIDNNNMDYYLLRTAVNFVLDDFKSVLQDSEKILEQNPNSVDVLEYRGFALRKVGKYSDALLLLNKLVEMNALNKTAILYRGLCYEDLDLPQKALQDYQMVLKLDPSDSTAQKLIELLQKKM